LHVTPDLEVLALKATARDLLNSLLTPMFARPSLSWHKYLFALICVFVATPCIFGQEIPEPTPKRSDEVIRVFTELVQTDVMVFDKQGKFVNGLTRENFELRVDGKVKPIHSFELITAGSDEEAQLAAARGSTFVSPTATPKKAVPLDRGRTVFFYVDDFHMDLAGFHATKKVINTFIDKHMGQNDQVAIASGTGQIGFLQQLTTERAVLKAALSRLNYRSYSFEDSDRPPMGVYAALNIDRSESDVYEFYISETIRLNPGMSREHAGAIVRQRASTLLQQSGAITMNTLVGLERLIRGVKDLPGRKVVFFLSGGFHIQNKRSDSFSKLRDITAAAARSGVIIYSMDSRGLEAPNSDFRDQPFDPSGRLIRGLTGELAASQDGLNALASDTGGRFVTNTNDLSQGLTPAIKETSVYYLLAWKPDSDNQKVGRFRNIQVNVVGRPEFSVRMRKGFFDSAPAALKTAAVKAPATPAEEAKTIATKLRETISAAYPQTELPLSLGINYYDLIGKGAIVSTAIQIPGEFLVFGPRNGKTQAVVDLTGVYFDDKGVPRADFVERLVTTAPSDEEAKTYRGDITYTYPANLPPGLYQVRVAARDEKSGRSGSAHGWIEIPDLTQTQLTMSSLLLGERTPAMLQNVSNPNGMSPVYLSPSHRFRRESNMRFLVFAYNATPAQTDQKPDVAVQVQVIRDDQPVITTALRKLGTDGLPDLLRIPYAAEVPLSDLLPGRYLLQVTLIDRVSKQSTSKKTQFEIY